MQAKNVCPHCGAVKRAAPKLRSKAKPRWPGPVYVARYADGQEVRMSFWSDARYPIDLEAASLQAAQHRPIKMTPTPEYPFGQPTGEFVRMVAFHVEFDGQRLSETEELAA